MSGTIQQYQVGVICFTDEEIKTGKGEKSDLPKVT